MGVKQLATVLSGVQSPKTKAMTCSEEEVVRVVHTTVPGVSAVIGTTLHNADTRIQSITEMNATPRAVDLSLPRHITSVDGNGAAETVLVRHRTSEDEGEMTMVGWSRPMLQSRGRKMGRKRKL